MPYTPGQIILDTYRIEALVGRGAFAEVYHATHLSLNAPRALKVLRRDAPGLGSTEYSDYPQRFQLEGVSVKLSRDLVLGRSGTVLDMPLSQHCCTVCIAMKH